ncbi:GNAT family N-acetyltransferase [Saliphagus sp. GCM10025308]
MTVGDDIDLVIELATSDDLEAVTECWVRLATDQRRHGSVVRSEANRETMRATLGAHQVDDGLLVARDGTRIIGFASFSVEHGALELACTRGFLSNLYVDPDYRGQGIGSALLEHVEASLADRGVDRLILEAMADNEAARRFYREAGYEPFRVGLERELDRPAENDTHSKDE